MARRLAFVLALVLVPAAARADKHPLGVDIAPSYESGSSLWGYHIAADVPVGMHRNLSAFVDFSHHAGLHEDVHLSRNTFLLGARYTFSTFWGQDTMTAAAAGERRGVCPFVHSMAAFVTEKGVGTSVTNTYFGLGAGADILFSKHGDAGFRVQADWIGVGSDNGHARASIGLVYRFEFH